MRQFLLCYCFLLAAPLFLMAQEPSKYDLSPCGAPSGIDPWLAEYKRGIHVVEDRSSDTLYAAIQIHLVAKDNGSGRFSAVRTLDAFCRLNEDFKASRIQFFSKADWNKIDSTIWYQHPTLPLGIDLMLSNNVPDALNCYFVNDPAGNCGYNLPYAGMAVAHTCASATDHTWAHEMGHALSLPHPFFGWEKKTYSFDQPTPLRLTVDYTYFHDTIDTQIPAPLDTAWVEYLDGHNCALAADLFCDTKPDYLSYRWPCNPSNNQSIVKQKDPNGAEFYSDGTLFMSYASDECSNRFSEDQIQAMRANLLNKKANVLHDGPVHDIITELSTPTSPVDNNPAPSFGALIEWTPVPNATHYLLQVSRLANFAGPTEYVVNGTSHTLGQLTNNVSYFWRVRAFNHSFACTNWSESGKFLSVPNTGTGAPTLSSLRCYPNLLQSGAMLTLEWGAFRQPLVRLELYNALGQSVWKDWVSAEEDSRSIRMPSDLKPGTYRLVARGNAGVKVASLSIHP